MVCWKDYVPTLRFWCVALWAIVLGLDRTASAIEWHTLTSFKDVRRLTVINDTLWAATSGGLLAIHDGTEPVTEYTNVDGLGTTDVFDIIMDGNGQKWVAAMGRLVRFGETESRQFLENDDNGDPYALYRIVDNGEDHWIGTSIRLELFSKTSDDGEFPFWYTRFGDLTDDPEIRDVLLSGDSIWLATSAGRAFGCRREASQPPSAQVSVEAAASRRRQRVSAARPGGRWPGPLRGNGMGSRVGSITAVVRVAFAVARSSC